MARMMRNDLFEVDCNVGVTQEDVSSRLAYVVSWQQQFNGDRHKIIVKSFIQVL
jgi:hypothetical protein